MFKDLLKELSLEEQRIPLDIDVPDDFYQSLLSQLLERDYLCDASDMRFVDLYAKHSQRRNASYARINWMQITRLPIHPNNSDDYDLLSRWQGVLTSLHAWGHRLYFLLLRHEGKTKLFLGASTSQKGIPVADAIEQFREAAFASMPGMGLRILDQGEDLLNEIYQPLHEMDSIGAVTGIPSLRNSEQQSLLQTLDQLAFGIRNAQGYEKDYAMMVIADPIDDREITDIVARCRRLGSQIHTAVKMASNTTDSQSESFDPGARKKSGASMLGTAIGAIGGILLGSPQAGGMIGANIGALIGGQIANTVTSDISRPKSVSSSTGLSTEYLDKFAEYAEIATEHHVKRLNEGRNFGFWNAGIYVLGNLPIDVMTVTGMLRSVYSGEETYYEPIRLHLFKRDSHAMDIVRNHLDLVPMLDADLVRPEEGFECAEGEWHLFGRNYQYVSTPLTTRELALATSLPRRDVPGLRFVKTAVRFANNPADISVKDRIVLGHIVDTGIVQETTYDIDINSLVRHALVSGSTGSGKSTTCKKILCEVLDRDVPMMVIEPAKDDYVRWAIRMNQSLPPEKRFTIYMPGAEDFEGTSIAQLSLNLFEPACAPGALVDLMQHSEIAATLLNACLPSEEVIPILIEETVLETINEWALVNNRAYEDGLVEPLDSYPKIDNLLLWAGQVMERKQYEDRVKANMEEVLVTRFKSLKRGMRGRILNTWKSVDYHDLFSGNVIINLSRLSGSKDKSLIMSLLMQALYEYRVSCYTNDAEYRHEAQQNKLLHLTLVEEAHNLLLKPSDLQGSGSPQRAAAELFGNMLSEVRGYGQGFIVVDQVPTRLIDDVIKNTNYKIVHRLIAPDDQAMLASSMAFREDQKYIIPALERGYAIVCGDEDDAAAWVRIPIG